MEDKQKALQPENDMGELPKAGNGSATAIVVIGFALAAVFVPVMMWPLEQGLFRDYLPLVLVQFVLSAAAMWGVLWLVYSGFMDEHLVISIAISLTVVLAGYLVQWLLAQVMSEAQPSYIAIAVGGFLGVIGFYGWHRLRGKGEIA